LLLRAYHSLLATAPATFNVHKIQSFSPRDFPNPFSPLYTRNNDQPLQRTTTAPHSNTATMDVILEALDTYAFDRLYATVLPLTPSILAIGTIGDFAGSNNATWSTMARGVTPYKFEPASQYFSVEPSSYAFMSQWPRDNIARQAISLFLITWYGLRRPGL
jgi:hypothetical protein